MRAGRTFIKTNEPLGLGSRQVAAKLEQSADVDAQAAAELCISEGIGDARFVMSAGGVMSLRLARSLA